MSDTPPEHNPRPSDNGHASRIARGSAVSRQRPESSPIRHDQVSERHQEPRDETRAEVRGFGARDAGAEPQADRNDSHTLRRGWGGTTGDGGVSPPPDLGPQVQGRMSSEERKLLMTFLLRRPAVTAAARGILVPEHFTESYEIIWALCWRCYMDLHDQYHQQPTREMLEAEALGRISTHPAEIPPEGVAELRQELERIYSADPATLGPDKHGLALLCKFLKERHVHDSLVELARDIRHESVYVDPLQLLAGQQQRMEEVNCLTTRSGASLIESWDQYEARLARYRGRALLGMRTGLPQFDRMTLGLRGLILLTSKPGIGKSSFFGHLMLGAVRHDASVCGVYVSLEMDRETIMQRIHAHLAGLPLPTVLGGSPELRGRDGVAAPPYFTERDQQKLECVRRQIEEIGPRLLILSRENLGSHMAVEAIRSKVAWFKQATGARNAVVVLDYLSLLDVPPEFNRTELEADKWRITQARRIVERTQTELYPEGDALLVIAESRKPGGGKGGGEWGDSMEDFMGSARLTYAAEMTLNFCSPTEDELQNHYGHAHPGSRQQIVAALEEEAVAPTKLKITKARGASKGEILYDYRFHEYTFVEKPHLNAVEQQRRQEERQGERQQAAHGKVKEFVIKALRSAEKPEEGLSQKTIRAAIGPDVKEAKNRKYDLETCLAELVEVGILETFEETKKGKAHMRWKLRQDPANPVAQPTPRRIGVNSLTKKTKRSRRRSG